MLAHWVNPLGQAAGIIAASDLSTGVDEHPTACAPSTNPVSAAKPTPNATRCRPCIRTSNGGRNARAVPSRADTNRTRSHAIDPVERVRAPCALDAHSSERVHALIRAHAVAALHDGLREVAARLERLGAHRAARRLALNEGRVCRLASVVGVTARELRPQPPSPAASFVPPSIPPPPSVPLSMPPVLSMPPLSMLPPLSVVASSSVDRAYCLCVERAWATERPEKGVLMRSFVFAFASLTVAFGCSSSDPQTNSSEDGLQVCPLLEIYCPPECHQSQGGCPKQCHCSNGNFNACGPSLKCGGAEVCCTGPGPVNIDPSLNQYSCNPPGTICPL
jgi:hypothetical protein